MDAKVESYRTTETLGKSQLELILQVYDGAIKAFKTAREHYQNNNNDDGYEQIQKARKFVTHLFTTLNTEKGGDIAHNLGKLYTVILCQIDTIEASKDLALIDNNVQLLSNLREGWVGLRDQQNETTPARPAASVEHINTAI